MTLAFPAVRHAGGVRAFCHFREISTAAAPNVRKSARSIKS